MPGSQDERTSSGAADRKAFNTSVANPARIWNYWLGGKDHFEVDRAAAEKVQEVLPSMRLLARLARRQLTDAVRLLAGSYGIRQFLDIGTGLPTADNTHEIAQRAAPGAHDPYGIVARLTDAMAAGSYLVIGHGASDIQADAVPEMMRRYNERSSAPITLRTRDQVARFFDGLELVGPGLVPLSQWWPPDQVDAGAASGVIGYCGMARKNTGPS